MDGLVPTDVFPPALAALPGAPERVEKAVWVIENLQPHAALDA